MRNWSEADYARMRARLESGLERALARNAVKVLDRCDYAGFLRIMDSNLSWAKSVVERTCLAIYRGRKTTTSIPRFCREYEIRLSDDVVIGLVERGLRRGGVLHDRRGLLWAYVPVAIDPTAVADELWDRAGEQYWPVLVQHIGLEKVKTVLETVSTEVVNGIAERPDVYSDVGRALLCAQARRASVKILFRNGSAEVQRELIWSGKYTGVLCQSVRRNPELIKDGVVVPNSIIAKALASGTVAEKQKVMGHLGRFATRS